MHDQRVRGWNIQPGLHDRGGEQDVVLAVVECRDDVFDDRWRHLSVRHRDLHLGHVLVEEILGLGEVFDARTHIERLPAAVPFAQQRLADHQRVERRNEGTHRQTIDRWRRNNRQLAHTGERQLQRARNWGRAERQHMDFGAQLLEPLLVSHTEVLFLVDDDETEILELDALAE